MPRTCKCGCSHWDKGREFDGRRCYRCCQCKAVHSFGLQGRQRRYSKQRMSAQFKDSKGTAHVG